MDKEWRIIIALVVGGAIAGYCVQAIVDRLDRILEELKAIRQGLTDIHDRQDRQPRL